MNELLQRISTKDILAVLVVTATLTFNGISLLTGKPLDAATMSLAGVVIGYYFKDGKTALKEYSERVGEPAYGDGEK